MHKLYKIILSYIFFFFFALGMLKCLEFGKSFKAKDGAITANATPITSKVIVVDAGHGKPDEGAVGIYGTTEEAINLKIALKLQRLIEQSGGIVVLTRSDENELYSDESQTIRQKKIEDVKNRVTIGNGEDVDILVSIHLNKYKDEKYSGWQAFYQKDSLDSQKLAKCIQQSLNDTIDVQNDRVPLELNNSYIMKNLKNPAVTIECGFLSNREEAKLLEEDSYQDKIAWGIYIGIQNYFK